jgi:hypothetical protein
MEQLIEWLWANPQTAGWGITLWLGWKAGALNKAINDLIKCHEKNEETLVNHGERIAVLERVLGKG